MQTIGERLLDARQRRGVSIREAAEATKVRGDYLAAMEANQFDSIPLADVYRRGFLKIYARFLRLDGDRVVGDFNALLAARNPVAPRGRRGEFVEPARSIEVREPEGMDEFSSGAIEQATRPDHEHRRRLIIAGVGVLVLILVIGGVVRACSGSSGDAKPDTRAVVDANAGTVVFRSKSTRSLSVSVKKAPAYNGGPEGEEVFREVIPPGGTATARITGEFFVHCTEPTALDFDVNGVSLRIPARYDYAKISVAPKGR